MELRRCKLMLKVEAKLFGTYSQSVVSEKEKSNDEKSITSIMHRNYNISNFILLHTKVDRNNGSIVFLMGFLANDATILKIKNTLSETIGNNYDYSDYVSFNIEASELRRSTPIYSKTNSYNITLVVNATENQIFEIQKQLPNMVQQNFGLNRIEIEKITKKRK